MKPAHLGLLTALGVAYFWSSACSPPRPRENPADDSDGSGGTTTVAPTPEIPDGLGGLGGAGSLLDCGPGPDPDQDFSKQNLLRSAAVCAELRFCEFQEAATVLSVRAGEFVADPTEAHRADLQAAFYESMRRWARAELFQFGPTASSADDMENGRGLRDLIYSWPNVSRCRVEEQLFGRAYADAGFDNLVQVPINSRGLFAVEYLSFYEGTDTDCGRFSTVNVDDAWNETSEADLNQLKHAYLEAVAEDVAGRAAQLRQVWSPDGENFREKLVSASAYMDQQEALNIVARALLYLEVEVKDYKLGAPAGLYTDAPLERPEVSFAGGGTELIQRNLAGFRDLFAGCGGSGLGYDDWLREAGHGDLADDLLTALDDAEARAKEFPPLSSASTTELQEFHAAIKAITDLLKNDFFGQGSPLGLTLPTAVEGDTD